MMVVTASVACMHVLDLPVSRGKRYSVAGFWRSTIRDVWLQLAGEQVTTATQGLNARACPQQAQQM